MFEMNSWGNGKRVATEERNNVASIQNNTA
jgi:hypothetical protein